jgi:hypothetical protein
MLGFPVVGDHIGIGFVVTNSRSMPLLSFAVKSTPYGDMVRFVRTRPASTIYGTPVAKTAAVKDASKFPLYPHNS